MLPKRNPIRSSAVGYQPNGFQDDYSRQVDGIIRACAAFSEAARKRATEESNRQIQRWQKTSITRIQECAVDARNELKGWDKSFGKELSWRQSRLLDDIRRSQRKHRSDKDNLQKWVRDLNYLGDIVKTRPTFHFPRSDHSCLHLLKIVSGDEVENDERNASARATCTDESHLPSRSDARQEIAQTTDHRQPPPGLLPIPKPHAYPVHIFGMSDADRGIADLFAQLQCLRPMEKQGPMSGRCEKQTHQMENFLTQTFGFRNIHGKSIVQGVKAFELTRPPESMPGERVIHFPHRHPDSFAMTVDEIIKWQRSYAVYTAQDLKGITAPFLHRALQGLSEAGDEAFLMKFVVRVSDCPILMEFDGRVIPRKTDEDWPNNIKLVSVTGIDFAGRIHDYGDITRFIENWRDVFEIDANKKRLLVLNGRDFVPQRGHPAVKLHEARLLESLMQMARLRLRACDEEGVQVVVETGIGLGVFAGSHIGIDGRIRAHSARAVRLVLEQDGLTYRHIKCVIFALPIFTRAASGRDTFHDFVDEFRQAPYKGPIPVLMADQDMHRLTVNIARRGWRVSELNPADSHGVFGEYWQNLGPAVEEKLALTTLGLLVQHHLINPAVLNPARYNPT